MESGKVIGDFKGDEIVITGIAGKFPESINIDVLKEKLFNGEDCVKLDTTRWDVENFDIAPRFGKIEDIDKIDRLFFGISPALVNLMDPMIRLLLEVAYEAITDSGYNPLDLQGWDTCTFTGSTSTESDKFLSYEITQQDGYGLLGSARTMLPNRISFFCDIKGSSFNIDAESTSGSFALQSAYNAIKNGRCDSALVGSSNLNLHPVKTLNLCQLGIGAQDGITRSFDEKANGCASGESIVMFFLQRATFARRVYAEIVSIELEYVDSYEENSLFIPTAESQVNVMRKALKSAGIGPNDIDFIEANGTSYKRFDDNELKAIDLVYGKERNSPIQVGSIKSNIGCSNSVNVLNSIIKAIFAMQAKSIPPNLHYENPSENADGIKEGRIRVVTEVTPWNGKYIAVNTGSYTGNFGHIILKHHPIEKENDGQPTDDLPRLVLFYGRTEEAVTTIFDALESKPLDVHLIQMLHDIYTKDNIKYLYRGYTILSPTEESEIRDKIHEVEFSEKRDRDIWYVFSGMGSQWIGMGESLMAIPVFAKAVQKCDAVLKPHGIDIVRIITEKDPHMFDNIIHSFVGIATIQVGLVDILNAVGMKPDYIIGHSVGELGCSYADGCFTAEQTVLAALSRGFASKESDLIYGAMAAVGLDYKNLRQICPPDIDIACDNGRNSVTISGPVDSIKAFATELQEKNIFVKMVDTSNIAYHSRYIAPAGPKLMKYLKEVIPYPKIRSQRWISTSVPKAEWASAKARTSSAEYHTNNLLNPVLFAENLSLISPEAVTIEISPHGLLQAILKRSLHSSCINIPLTKREHPNNCKHILTALGKLYKAGVNFSPKALYPSIRYPVGTNTASISPLMKWDHSENWFVFYQTNKKQPRGERTIGIDLSDKKFAFLKNFKINGTVTIPCSFYLIHSWDILKSLIQYPDQPIIFKDIFVHKSLTVSEDSPKEVTIMVQYGSGRFEIIDGDETVVITGTILSMSNVKNERSKQSIILMKNNEKYLTTDDVYENFRSRGFEYTGDFKSIEKYSMDSSNGQLVWRDWLFLIDAMMQMHAIKSGGTEFEMPVAIRKIVIDTELHKEEVTKRKILSMTINKEFNVSICGGVEMQGVALGPVEFQPPNGNLAISEVFQFVPNQDDNTEMNLSEVFHVTLQLLSESFLRTKDKESITIIEEAGNEETVGQIRECLENVVDNVKYNFDVNVVSDERAASIDEKSTSLFLVPEISTINRKYSTLFTDDKKLLLTFVKEENQSRTILAAENFGLGVAFKRKTVLGRTALLICKKRVSKKTLVVKENAHWSTTLKRGLTNPSYDRVIFLIKNKVYEDIFDIVKDIEYQPKDKKLQIVDIRDETAPSFAPEATFYQYQLQLNFLHNVLMPKKVWGSYKWLPFAPKLRSLRQYQIERSVRDTTECLRWMETPSIEKDDEKDRVKVEYAVLNEDDSISTNPKSKNSRISARNTRNVEYSGMDGQGRRVMGIANSDAIRSSLRKDPEYTWTIPDRWSFEDAATVPLPYLVAYAALYVNGAVEKKQSILVQSGASNVSQAIINLAEKEGCEIYTTYDTKAEKEMIESIEPKIPSNRIFPTKFVREYIIRETKSKGVDLVIGSFMGMKVVESLLCCCSIDGRIVLIGNIEEISHESFATQSFLMTKSLHIVNPSHLISLDSRTKNVLSNMLKRGLEFKVVKPFLNRRIDFREITEIVVEEDDFNNGVEKILIEMQPKNRKILGTPKTFFANAKSYLILEGINAFGVKVIDWLIDRGVRKIVWAIGRKNENNFLEYWLKKWQVAGATIAIYEEVDLSKKENVKSLMQEAAKMGQLEGIMDLQRIINATKLSANRSTITKILDEESRELHATLKYFAVLSVLDTFKEVSSNFSSMDSQMKSICERRSLDNLHGLFVTWGPIREMGSVQDEVSELDYICTPQCLRQLDDFLATNVSVVAGYGKKIKAKKDTMEEKVDEKNEEQLFKEYLNSAFKLI